LIVAKAVVRKKEASSMDSSNRYDSGVPRVISTETGPLTNLPAKEWEQRLDDLGTKFRLPRSVQSVYLKPLRRQAKYGLPACDIQLRSYSVRNVEFFADFALRAAYYLDLPASGPVPLPRIVERWTIPKSNFVHKKSQENFERITFRRLIQIVDGHPDGVQVWLAFLRKYAFHGVGMKANVWEHEGLGIGKLMDKALGDIEQSIEPLLAKFGRSRNAKPTDSISDLLDRERFVHSHSPLTDVRSG